MASRNTKLNRNKENDVEAKNNIAEEKDESEHNLTKPNSAKLSRATVLVGGEGKVGLSVRFSVTERY